MIDEPAYLLAARSNVRADAPTSATIVRMLLEALDARPHALPTRSDS